MLVQAESVHLGLNGLSLRGVHAHSTRSGRIEAEFGQIDAPWTFVFGAESELSIVGGLVRLRGTIDELRAELQAVTTPPKTKEARTRRLARCTGVSSEWTEFSASSVTDKLSLTGLAGVETPTGVAVTWDSGNWERGGLHFESGHGELEVGRGEGAQLLLRRLSSDSVMVTNAGAAATESKLPVRAAAPSGANRTGVAPAPASQEARRTPAPAGSASLRPTRGIEPGTPSNSLLDRLDPKRMSGELFELVRRVRSEVQEHASSLSVDPTKVSVGQLGFDLRLGSERLRLGPWTVTVGLSRSELTLCVRPAAASSASGATDRAPREASRFELNGRVPIGDGLPVTARVTVDGVSPAELGVAEGDLGLQGVTGARLKSHLDISVTRDRIVWSTDGSAAGIALKAPWLASATVQGIEFDWRTSGNLEAASGKTTIDASEVHVGAARLLFAGKAEPRGQRLAFESQFEVPLAACDALASSLPSGLAPLLQGMRFEGYFALKGRASFDPERPASTTVDWKLANGCRARDIPERISTARFREAFTLEVEDANRRPTTMAFGPGTSAWTPETELSPFLESAVLVCEDGRFLSHDGIDQAAIRSSIIANLKAGRFQRGASTVTMQLAKNLYLRREKTLARKAQEAVLTMLLEQQLRKPDILALYFNVIEYGPGLYGIGPAAKFYFNTTPEDLSVGEAFFLVSILPNPKASHFDKQGHLSPYWSSSLKRLMTIAHQRHRLTDEELERGLNEEVRFGGSPPSREAESRPTRSAASSPNGATGEELGAGIRQSGSE